MTAVGERIPGNGTKQFVRFSTSAGSDWSASYALLGRFGEARRGRRVASDEERKRALSVSRHKVESQQTTLLESLCMKATPGLTPLAPTMKVTCVRITTPRGTGWATMATAPQSAAVRRQGATDP